MSPPPANAICPDPPPAGARAALRDPVAPRRVTDTPASRPGPAPCARRASRVLGWRFMNCPARRPATPGEWSRVATVSGARRPPHPARAGAGSIALGHALLAQQLERVVPGAAAEA